MLDVCQCLRSIGDAEYSRRLELLHVTPMKIFHEVDSTMH